MSAFRDDPDALFSGVERKPLAPRKRDGRAPQPELFVGIHDDPGQQLMPGIDAHDDANRCAGCGGPLPGANGAAGPCCTEVTP